jgi:hypothetical protein
MEKDEVPPAVTPDSAKEALSEPMEFHMNGPRLKVVRPVDPRTRPGTPLPQIGRWVKWLLAAVAAMALLVANLATIQNWVVTTFGTPDSAVRTSWVTVEDPTDLRKCVLDTGGFRVSTRKLPVLLVENACLKELQALAPPSQAASGTSFAMQNFRDSTFLAIENLGTSIEEVRLFDRKGGQNPVATFRSLDGGVAKAVCVGYSGIAGARSRRDVVQQIEVQRSGKPAVRFDVPIQGKALATVDSTCLRQLWEYPTTPATPSSAVPK